MYIIALMPLLLFIKAYQEGKDMDKRIERLHKRQHEDEILHELTACRED